VENICELLMESHKKGSGGKTRKHNTFNKSLVISITRKQSRFVRNGNFVMAVYNCDQGGLSMGRRMPG
jgi:hypothetical protein